MSLSFFLEKIMWDLESSCKLKNVSLKLNTHCVLVGNKVKIVTLKKNIKTCSPNGTVSFKSIKNKNIFVFSLFNAAEQSLNNCNLFFFPSSIDLHVKYISALTE
jgi:hypothetical protein